MEGARRAVVGAGIGGLTAAVALRPALVGAASRLGPGFRLRGFDGIADRRPRPSRVS
ncbi:MULTISPECIES: hypothetical protein [unclassified Streptomyces]|uniref:hypothetical protein n=1 Tax=unclassified Streptomyces TaxID=2593676 RepID=UPI0035DE4203